MTKEKKSIDNYIDKKEIIQEPQDLQLLIDKLDTEINLKKNQLSNLESRIEDAKIRKEEIDKQDKTTVQIERNQLMIEIAALKGDLNNREDSLNREKEALAQREQSVISREEQILNAESIISKAAEQRYEIMKLDDAAKENIELAIIKRVEIAEQIKMIDDEKKNILLEKENIKNMELLWNTRLGELEQWSKCLELQEKNVKYIEDNIKNKLLKNEKNEIDV